jgi:tetratricopeptide (TPR) repeat protein
MERIEKTVFISYRRTNVSWALAIYHDLTQHGYDVFFDFNGIASGDFESIILENVRARAHFIVVLTPSALKRCSESGDWLRREIETAIQAKRNIVPLLLEGSKFGAPAISQQLTGKLEPLRHYNALNIPADYFAEAMERLRDKFLNVALEAVSHPASSRAQKAARAQQTAATAAYEVKEEKLTAETYFERGCAAEDPAEQIRLYDKAIRLDPGYAFARYNRGLARKAKGDVEGALADYDEAIQLNPDDADFYNARGAARYGNGDLKRALADYGEAIRLNPDHAFAHYNRGLARKAKGDVEGALADYDEAIQLNPDDADFYFYRGVARYENEDMEGALADYGEAIQLNPDYANAHYNRGLIRKAKGDVEGALADYDEAIQLNPDDADFYFYRGVARSENGDVEGAMADYGEAIRLKPDYANAYYNRALLKKNDSEHRAAIADFQKYLDLGGGERDGDQAEVEEFIRDLKAKL